MKLLGFVLFFVAAWLFYSVGGWHLCAAVILFSISIEIDTNERLDKLHRAILATLEQWRNGGF